MQNTLIILTLLAVWRLARLVTTDYLFDGVRRKLAGTEADIPHIDYYPEPGEGSDQRPMVGYLLTCPWCFSMWLGLPVAAVVVLWPDNRAVWALMLALSASGVAGMLATLEKLLDRVAS